MNAPDLRPLLNPESIAIVGASPTSRVGVNMVRNLLQLGYRGRIYPVNPRYDEVLGLPCFPSIAAVPGPVDAALLGVATERVVPLLREAAQNGVRAAVIGTTGFAEAGEAGRQRQADLQRIAAEHGIVVCGPNCMGLISIANHQAMYTGGIPNRLTAGRVAAVCQSGTAAIALLQSGRLTFSHLISSGNEAVVNTAEYLAHLVEDPNTDVLLAFIEGLRSPELFLQVARRARDLRKPLIVLKVGVSEKAATATLSHTGSLAGSAAIQEAMFRQFGIIRVDDLDELIEAAVLCAAAPHRLPSGSGVGLTSGSGGQIGLALDIAEQVGIQFPALTESTLAGLRSELPIVPSLTNPLDAWGTGDLERTYANCLQLVADDANVDLVAVVQNAPAAEDPQMRTTAIEIARVTSAVARRTVKPVVFISGISGMIDPEVVAVLGEAGVPALLGTREALKAIAGFTRYAEFLRRDNHQPDRVEPVDVHQLVGRFGTPAGPLSEYQGLQLLARFGVPVVRHALAGSATEAIAIAEQIGFPVAVKACSPDLAHKTDAGAVRLNVGDAPAVAAAFEAVVANARRAVPGLEIQGVLVEQMHAGVEMIVGVTVDPDFGPAVLLGLGGIYAEVLQDTSLRLAPVTRQDAADMIQELRGRALLEGHRGQPAADKAALVDVLVRLSSLALACRDQIAQLDVNPLIVSASGAVAADALVVSPLAG